MDLLFIESFWLLEARRERAEAEREKPVVAVIQGEMMVVVAALRNG